ncbi:MAG: alanine racemase [Planctomycetes bacterium]|nr:alanine racemase [Planctomycetota bacterium]
MSNGNHRVWAEISTGAVRHNLARIRKAARGLPVMAVLKANAYGHGAAAMAALLVKEGIDCIGVGDSGEALELRQAGIKAPILIVGGVVPGEMPRVVAGNIEVNLHTVEMAHELDAEAARQGCRVRVHLKVDTGMGRLGMQPFEAVPFLHSLRKLKQLELVGLCTHFSTPNEPDPAFTTRQLEHFNLAVEVARRLGYADLLLHASSSLAFFGRKDALFNMVRTGIALWGHLPGDLGGSEAQLRPALQLKTRVLFLKDVPEGTPIGYNRTWYSTGPTRIATLPVGYDDGYRTAMSNRAYVLVRGVRCPVVGRVSMDYTTVDVGRVPGAKVGDEVTLLGGKGDGAITLAEAAGWAGCIPYEFLCGLGRRVVRVYE